jgi:hypothetical protein
LTPFFNGIDPQEYLKIIEEESATIIPRKRLVLLKYGKAKHEN